MFTQTDWCSEELSNTFQNQVTWLVTWNCYLQKFSVWGYVILPDVSDTLYLISSAIKIVQKLTDRTGRPRKIAIPGNDTKPRPGSPRTTCYFVGVPMQVRVTYLIKRSSQLCWGQLNACWSSRGVTADSGPYSCIVCRCPNGSDRASGFMVWRRSRGSKLLYPLLDSVEIKNLCVITSPEYWSRFCHRVVS
jgi:hypothetical protein